LVRAAVRQFSAVDADAAERLVSAARAFIRERLENLLRERGYTANEVAAVMAAEGPESPPERLDLVPPRPEAVREFGKLAEAASLAAANKRIGNILRQSRQKNEPVEAPRADTLADPLEQALFGALEAAAAKAGAAFERGDYRASLESFAVLRAPV